ncbi:hypothetical protein NE865_10253 [Phthorimaea operculella]|nr:hypothetical protein NE865_10253 [Phthorimaea operculella]
MDSSDVFTPDDQLNLTRNEGDRTPSPTEFLQAMVNKKTGAEEENMDVEKTSERPIKRERSEGSVSGDEQGEWIKNEKKKFKPKTQNNLRGTNGPTSTQTNPVGGRQSPSGAVFRTDENAKKDKFEVYISCKEKLPKQFALAKLFKELNIVEILKLRYLTPYKIRAEFESQESMQMMTTCEELISKGWKFQEAYHVSYSFGLIRNVDLDLTDDEIAKCIRCNDERAIVSSAMRLKRLVEGNWVPSETVRVCFKGSFLPQYVYVDDMRIKVEPFVFPVSQCSKCWQLGHTRLRCPSKTVVCPKCSKNHNNCTTQSFVCVNCKGDHMALDRSRCPVYQKEKKIRSLMSEFNCTYRVARSMYVPESPLVQKKESAPTTISGPQYFPGGFLDEDCQNTCGPPNEVGTDTEKLTPKPVYAQVLKVKAQVHKEPNKGYQRLRQSNTRPTHQMETVNLPSDADEDRKSTTSSEEEKQHERNVTFSELLSRLKNILFFKKWSLEDRLTGALKCCVEWLILVVAENLADWPVLKLLINYFNG